MVVCTFCKMHLTRGEKLPDLMHMEYVVCDGLERKRDTDRRMESVRVSTCIRVCVCVRSRPVVEKMPPIIPQSRMRNFQRGMCCSVTLTMRELMSYFIKIPETPWLPVAWFITRSCIINNIHIHNLLLVNPGYGYVCLLK